MAISSATAEPLIRVTELERVSELEYVVEFTRLFEPVMERAQTQPQAAFLTDLAHNHVVTYGELSELSLRLASISDRWGLHDGDGIAIFTRTNWVFFPLLMACSIRGLRLVPLNPELHEAEAKKIVQQAAVAVLIWDGPIPGWANALDRTACITVDDMLKMTSAVSPVALSAALHASPDAAALIIYTSGTTGSPKGVVLTPRNLVTNATYLAKALGLRAGERMLSVLPLYNMNAIMITGLTAIVAGSHVISAGLFSPMLAKSYWDLVSQHSINICSLVPSIMAILMRLFPEGVSVPLPDLRFALSGAAPLGAELWTNFEKTFGVAVYQGYGLTETTCWATVTPPGNTLAKGSVGLAIGSCIEIQPFSADDWRGLEGLGLDLAGRGSKACLGEILIRGPLLMHGYYGRPDLTAAQFDAQGRFRTGDIGYVDNGGALWICGRIKEMIIRGGVKIVPDQVDSILIKHDEVLECKTIGVADPILGEAVVTVFVPKGREPIELARLHDWLQERISSTSRPDRLLRVGRIPKGPTGKVALHRLRQVATGETHREILRALTMRRFRRSQPPDLGLLSAFAERACLHGTALRFICPWGVGQRSALGSADMQTLQNLHDYVDNIRLAGQVPVELTLVFHDIQASLNGVPPAVAKSYFGAIAETAGEKGFSSVYQSDLWAEGTLKLEDLASVMDEERFSSLWNDAEIRMHLLRQAQRRNDTVMSEEGARRYLAVCVMELPFLQRKFAEHALLTFTRPELDRCLPSIARLYLFSIAKGTSDKPWFSVTNS